MSLTENLKHHKFNYFIGFVVLLLFTSELSVLFVVAKNNQTIKELENKINNNHVELNANLKNSELAINSRIDIIDSAIQIDEKRRMLIKKIRTAITENAYTKLDVRTLTRIAVAVIDYSYTYNLSIARVLAIIKKESDFNPNAISKADAKGLGQLLDSTAEYIALKSGRIGLNVFNIENNVFMTCFYLAQMMNTFNNEFETAVGSYNAGPNTMKKHKAGLIELPEETKEYIPAVLEFEKIFKQYGLE